MGLGVKMGQSVIRLRRKTITARVDRQLPNTGGEYQTLNILEAGEFTRHPISSDAEIGPLFSGGTDIGSDTLYLASLPDESSLPTFRIGDLIIPVIQTDNNDFFTIVETPVNLGNGDRTLSMVVMNQTAINRNP